MKILHHYVFLFLTLFTITSFSKKLEAGDRYTYEIAICAIFRDDARFLKEWIEFHRVVGVEHFWLFNNLSDDDYMSVLSPYIEEGVVDLIEWPYESKNWEHWHSIQKSAYKKGIQLASGVAKWLAILDSDEFLFPVRKKRLNNVLKDYEKYGGVGVNWQLYGTSGVKRLSDNRLMIEQLVMKADENFLKNRFIKSIIRPERATHNLPGHYFEFHGKYYQVDENKKKLADKQTKKVNINKLRINHYWTRDEEFLYDQKISRRGKEGSNIDGILKDCKELNKVLDKSILRFASGLKRRMSIY